jgi:hypothetical protein
VAGSSVSNELSGWSHVTVAGGRASRLEATASESQLSGQVRAASLEHIKCEDSYGVGETDPLSFEPRRLFLDFLQVHCEYGLTCIADRRNGKTFSGIELCFGDPFLDRGK